MLAAAVVIAVALAPVLFAYLQLGAHPDVRGPAPEPGAEAERFLERATHEAGANATGEYDWSAREGAVERVRGRLRPRLATLESSRVESGTVYRVSYDRAAAREWARANCPGRNGAGGEGREFGACVADRGVVVQERAGETVPVAVAYSVRVTGARGRYAFTFVCRVVE